jgi:signal transduction histidine kinase
MVFCLALISLFNFGAFSAQASSLAVPVKNIGFGATTMTGSPSATVLFQNADSEQSTVTLESIQKRFGQQLMIVDGLLILCAIVFSYILSGLTLQPIRKTLKEQEEFAQEISHELRTPLSIMALEIETIKRDGGKKNLDVVRNIGAEIARMNQLVDGLMTLMRPYDKSQHSGSATSFDISAVARRTLVTYQKIAATKKVMLHFESTYKGKAFAHEGDISQSLGILLDNAIKYTGPGGMITLAVAAAPNKKVHIVVRDTGQGIARRDLPHIFDRFYRARHNSASNEAGFGIGLAIAQKRIIFNNGSIEIESTVGQGTTAHIYLPAATTGQEEA